MNVWFMMDGKLFLVIDMFGLWCGKSVKLDIDYYGMYCVKWLICYVDVMFMFFDVLFCISKVDC